MSANVEMDAEADAVCDRLRSTFNLPYSGVETSPGQVSIGIEVEVPWSSFFPGLWRSFRLQERKISDLGADELTDLSAQCTVLEADLLPRLHKTVECGIPRGNDRYWEFSMRPVHSAGLLAEQVRLLTAADLLPRDRRHSLHVTLGGLPRCEALYYLCLLLELEFVEPDRIRHGIAQTRKPIHTGWARKGLAGIFEKGPNELEGGAVVAAEIRMLQLPQSDDAFGRLMTSVQWGANAIADVRAGRDTEAAGEWQELQERAKQLLVGQGLPLANWSRGGQQYDVWEQFCQAMPQMREALWSGAQAPIRERFASVA